MGQMWALEAKRKERKMCPAKHSVQPANSPLGEYLLNWNVLKTRIFKGHIKIYFRNFS
jgi:hypothetical protein